MPLQGVMADLMYLMGLLYLVGLPSVPMIVRQTTWAGLGSG